MDLATYLFFDGHCEAAFRFYEKVLGGHILMMLRYQDAPADMPASEESADRIMHARMKIGERVLMGSDAPKERFNKPQGYRVNITVDSAADAERIFAALSEGGSIAMPMGETFFAHRFGMVNDRFGTPWMVNCEKAPGSRPSAGTQSGTQHDGRATHHFGMPRNASKPFVILRTFPASRETVWKAFTNVEQMKQWWGPKGATIKTAKMDLKPGGAFHYGMVMPDGME